MDSRLPLPSSLSGLVPLADVGDWLRVAEEDVRELCAKGWLDTVTRNGRVRVTEDSLRRLAISLGP